jgi:hypothetical protein
MRMCIAANRNGSDMTAGSIAPAGRVVLVRAACGLGAEPASTTRTVAATATAAEPAAIQGTAPRQTPPGTPTS